MGIKKPVPVGKCERVLTDCMGGERTCGKAGRYLVYGTRILCKQCYQAYRKNPWNVLFNGRRMSAAEAWELHQRLRVGL